MGSDRRSRRLACGDVFLQRGIVNPMLSTARICTVI